MINYLWPWTSRRLFRRSIRRLGREGAGECEQRRPTKPNRFAVESGVFHMPGATHPREGNIRYLNPESVETGKARASRKKEKACHSAVRLSRIGFRAPLLPGAQRKGDIYD
jgi:hypothetical protein